MEKQSKENNFVQQTTITNNDRLAYSVDEISQLTSLSKPFLRNEIRAGRLKIKRFGKRRVCVLAQDLETYLQGEK